MAQVICNLPKPGEEVRYVDVINGIGGKQRLCVDASLTVGSLTIGGVYIQDDDTGVRADVVPINSLNALVVEDAFVAQKTRVVEFDENIVAPNATIVLNSYTVPAGLESWMTGVTIGGNRAGIFEIYASGTLKIRYRNSGSDRTKEYTFPEWLFAMDGQSFEIKVTNIDNLNGTFEATWWGFTKNMPGN